MTFDDGILTICSVENDAKPGMMPKPMLVIKERFYYGYDTIGISRYYTALQANQRIEAVVNVPGWGDIAVTDICVLENGNQMRIVMRQPMQDENGLRITKLSLERVDEEYDIKAENYTRPINDCN